MTTNLDSSQLHPIGVVAERTGLTPELLRVWERRYNAVVPIRSEGGGRLYSDADILRLRLLKQAVRAGRQIGQVAKLPPEKLRQLVQQDREDAVEQAAERANSAAERVVAESLERARELNGEALEELMKRAAAIEGTQDFLSRVVAPFLQAVGDEWHAGRLSVAQEHLASRVVQRVVMRLFDSLRPPPNAPVFVAAALSGDRHEMGVLLSAATAASEGWEVVLLGADLPAAEIAAAARGRKALVVGISVVFVESAEETLKEIELLSAQLSDSTHLLVGGGAASSLFAGLNGGNMHCLEDLGSLRDTLRSLQSQG